MDNMLSEQDQYTPVNGNPAPALSEDQLLRQGAYSLLAALLRSAPDQAVLDHLSTFLRDGEPDDDAAATALRLLGLAARDTSPDTAETEYNKLFIGIGRGELVPFGSWYMTGFLMEEPLSVLRDDLVRLGFERQEDVHEPEDHIAALCEVLSMLIGSGTPHEQQEAFFDNHLKPWVERFFVDLENANNACFYRAVARFGQAFFELESRYFAMQL